MDHAGLGGQGRIAGAHAIQEECKLAWPGARETQEQRPSRQSEGIDAQAVWVLPKYLVSQDEEKIARGQMASFWHEMAGGVLRVRGRRVMRYGVIFEENESELCL